MSEYNKLIRELGELLQTLDLRRMDIGDISRKLYGTSMRPSDFTVRFWLDLERGLLEVRDYQVCYGPRCVDLAEVITKMREYYELLGERRKLLRLITEACRT